MNKEELITIFKNILEEYSPNTEPLSLEGEYEIEYIQVESLMNYINNLKQENNKLKEQYCERTDCGGRIGNSRKVEKLIQENKELHNKIDKAIEYIENADWYLPQWEIRDKQPDKNSLLEILKDNE